jgi:hypothetical protein
MEPDKVKKPRPARDEFEVARHMKELGRPLQRQLLQRRLHEVGDNSVSAAAHGEEAGSDQLASPPREDRAG